MFRLFYSAVIFFSSCISGIAQQETSPAFLMLEEVMITADDPRFAPLFYSTSESGEGSLAYVIFSAVESGKLKLWSDPVIMDKILNWDTLRKYSGHTAKTMIDKNKAYKLYPNGDIPQYMAFNVNNIQQYKIKYLVCYDNYYVAISRKVVSITPYLNNPIYYDWYNTSSYNYIYEFSLNDTTLTGLLSEKMDTSGFENISFLEYLSSISVDSMHNESYMISFSYANANFKGHNYINAIDSIIEYPEMIQLNSRIVIYESKYPEKDLYGVGYNTFSNDSSSYSITKLSNCNRQDFSNFPLVYPVRSEFGFDSVDEVIWYVVTHSSNNMYHYNDRAFFNKQMSRKDRDNTFYYKRKLGKNTYDPFTGEEISGQIVEGTVSFDGFLFLFLMDGTKKIPLAICPTAYIYKKNRKIDKGPLGWFPINNGLRQKLVEGKAYLLGFGIEMNLMDYISSEILSGNIISERPIDNAEWQKMLEVLR